MKAVAINERPASRLQRLAVGAGIVALIWIVFGQTLAFEFVNYDDKTYVYDNSLVKAGLSLHGLAHAFVDVQTSNWHPLTIISHMIDCQIFGLKAGAQHFTNVLLHSVAAILLLNFLVKVTSRFWESAFVTALFAVHPLRVESVAWIAERKDVLSAVFFFLTLLAYVRYVRAKSFGRYFIMSILFACGLMSKPMLVTTPLVLLLLDYWPLQRFAGANSTAGGRESGPAGRVGLGKPVARFGKPNGQLSAVFFSKNFFSSGCRSRPRSSLSYCKSTRWARSRSCRLAGDCKMRSSATSSTSGKWSGQKI